MWYYVHKEDKHMSKQKFTTTINSELLEKIKIQAIKEKRSVSDMLEEMIKNYLQELESRNRNGGNFYD